MSKLMTGAAAAALLFCGEAALSDAGAVTVYRGASGAAPVVRTVERGLNVYRGPKSADADLAGARPTPTAPRSEITVLMLRDCRRARSLVRTQGFYSGHDGYSRRFTQGFWSGPADLGRRARILVLRRGS